MNSLIIFGAKYLIAIVCIIFVWFFLQQNKSKKRQMLIFSLLALPLAYLLAKISSLFYFDPRPFVVGNFMPLIPHVADNGFPSDHTLLSSTLAAIVYFFNKKWGIALFVLTILIGFSRVLAGVHHSVDIIGAIIISIIASWIIAKFASPIFSKK